MMMADAPASGSFAFRRWLLPVAWILLALSLLIPPPAGSFAGDAFGVSASYVYGKAIVWSEALPGSPASLGFLRCAILALALFSNVAFLFMPMMVHVRCVSIAWKGFLLVAFAIDASIAFLVPELARLPAYWIWLASFAALAIAFVVFPDDEEMRPWAKSRRRRSPLDRGEVTPFFWVLLGFTLLWLAVSAASYFTQLRGGGAVAAGVPLTTYVTDRASLLKRDETEQLTRALEKFANQTSTQIAVAIYPRAPGGPIDDFTIRIADRSRVGASGLDNGAILFLFMEERAARLEIGYGLESTVTDVEAHRILEADLAPAFAHGTYSEGLGTTLRTIIDLVQIAAKDGREQGRPALWKKKTKGGFRKMLETPLLAFGQIGLIQRIVITFCGGLFGALFWQGIQQWTRLARDLARGVGNVLARRPFLAGMEAVDMGEIGGTLAMLGWTLGVLIPAAGFLALAAGGTFGGAGALIHW